MASNVSEWKVTRQGGTVYVDISGAGRLSRPDTEAILKAVEQFLLTEDVSIVQVHGPEVPRVFNGLARSIKAIHQLSERFGVQLVIGPI